MNALSYPYASGDLLENRNTYFYTPFGGWNFLRAWRHQRQEAHAACGTCPSATETPGDTAPTAQTLRRLNTELLAGALPAHSRNTLDRILQRFEVSKRLHDDYTAAWKPLDPDRYHGLERYLLLAEALGQAAASTSDLRYLNGLLKCVDTLTAAHAESGGFRDRLRTVLDRERELVDRIARRPSKPQYHITQAIPPVPPARPLTLRGIGLIAAPTARSRAYIQALAASGLHPEFVLLLGDHDSDGLPASPPPQCWQGIPLVNLGETVIATCRRAGIPTRAIGASSVNDAPVLEAMRQLRPHTLIYSGAGGQIVSPEALGLGVRFLHMHAGHIPDYRGSTTIYYALLNGEPPAVTALFLDARIDTGAILAQRSYPAPDRGIDIDRAYDASIRADTLTRLLHEYANEGTFAPARPQRQDEGTTYFVIHPVLKHLAILNLPEPKNG